MAEQIIDQDEPQGNEGGKEQETDYKSLYEQMKAESRKWEGRAKANKEKADKWDAASGGNESVEERIAKLESENQAMRDAKERHDLVTKVAAATKLEYDVVASLNGTDEETLTKQAQAIAGLKPKGAPNAPEAGKFPRADNAKDDDKRKFVRQLFGEE